MVIDLFTNITRVFAYVCLNMKYNESLCYKSRRLQNQFQQDFSFTSKHLNHFEIYLSRTSKCNRSHNIVIQDLATGNHARWTRLRDFSLVLYTKEFEIVNFNKANVFCCVQHDARKTTKIQKISKIQSFCDTQIGFRKYYVNLNKIS